MKIGILTHHYIANFGAFLQAYALQETIKNEFPNDEVFIINYINLKHFIINNGGWLRYNPARETIGDWLQKIQLPITFYQARHKFMNLTKRCYNINDINRLGFDVIMIGSDEVWNFKDKKSNSSIKFGQGLICKKLIAYAPSVGNSSVKDKIPEYVINGIKKFSAISVRDSLGQEVVKYISGIMPIKVLDPTFLIEFPTEKVKLPNENFILFYYSEHLPNDIKNSIFSYACSHGLAVYGAGECNKQFTTETVKLTPFQWVWMFKHAKLIITGTFHGTALSIENKKPFKVYLTQKNRIRKVNDLLETLDIRNRNINGNWEIGLNDFEHEIDYAVVNERISQEKKKSIRYLHQAINDLI